jgi:hypothetical protein
MLLACKGYRFVSQSLPLYAAIAMLFCDLAAHLLQQACYTLCASTISKVCQNNAMRDFPAYTLAAFCTMRNDITAQK